jgi:hypothetical protein
MSPEQRRIPNWAARERLQDLEWVGENFHIFWPTATAAFAEQGRGALVVDTTQQPVEGKGHPFGYFPQAVVETGDDEDIRRMVREYDPEKEFVVVMLKSAGRTSTYRVQPQRRQN